MTMPSLQKLLSTLTLLLLLLLLLHAAPALAVAGRKPNPKHPGRGDPTAHCIVDRKSSNGVRDTYELRGTNWNVTGAQLKAGIETPGTVVTGWEFKEAIDVDDRHTFKAKVRMPLVHLSCFFSSLHSSLVSVGNDFFLAIRCFAFFLNADGLFVCLL